MTPIVFQQKSPDVSGLAFNMVRWMRLELTRPLSYAPQTYASAYSAIPAYHIYYTQLFKNLNTQF